jgi:hypothetical protein
MAGTSGSIAYLRHMAERCRRAAEDRQGEDARYLVEIAERCEERLAEQERAAEMVASEED